MQPRFTLFSASLLLIAFSSAGCALEGEPDEEGIDVESSDATRGVTALYPGRTPSPTTLGVTAKVEVSASGRNSETGRLSICLAAGARAVRFDNTTRKILCQGSVNPERPAFSRTSLQPGQCTYTERVFCGGKVKSGESGALFTQI